MIITDSQVHLWMAETRYRRWPRRSNDRERAAVGQWTDQFLLRDLIEQMNCAGVGRAVLVPPSFEGDKNGLCLRATVDEPDRLAVMGRITLTQPLTTSQLAAWAKPRSMRGLRLTFHRAPADAWLARGEAEWLWSAAQALDLPVSIYAPDQLSSVRSIAQRYPDLRIAVDHLGLESRTRDDAILPVIAELSALSPLKNVSVKASGLTGNSAQAYPYPALHAPLERIFDAFGPRRMFWGSDLTRVPGTYFSAVNLFVEALGFLSSHDLEWVMGRAISEWLNWPVGEGVSAFHQ